MPELRKDAVSGRWVIISTERSKRPSAFVNKPSEKINPDTKCPFCAGNEAMTPPEVLSYRGEGSQKDKEGWWIRVVPNKFPALRIEEDAGRAGDGMYDKMNGVGAHEVIIETPKHDLFMADMNYDQISEVIWAYRDRIIELRKDDRFRYILIFKNHGREAGASLDHPHSQLIALPIIPKRVQEELAGSLKYWEYKERCVYCDIVHQEQKDGKRIVYENDHFISTMPFASRFPYESWILPKVHDPFFHDITKTEVLNLAKCLKDMMWRIKEVLGDPPLNFVLHTTPFGYDQCQSYHWHIEIMPKLTQVAGFEWGTGFYINPTTPEDAAEELKKVKPSF